MRTRGHEGGMLRIASKPFFPNFLYSSARFGYERQVPAIFKAIDCLMMPLSSFELKSFEGLKDFMSPIKVQHGFNCLRYRFHRRKFYNFVFDWLEWL